MTIEETVDVMDILTGAYPRFYAGASDENIDSAMDVWASIFAQDDPCFVIAAVRSFIEGDEKGFPPVPGQIKAKMRLIMEPDQMSEMEAWTLVSGALKNSAYGASEEFEKFPPIIKRIVGNPGQLREWGMMDSEIVHSVVASNFQRSYKAISTKEREIGKLPADVRKTVDALRMMQKPMPELPTPGADGESAIETTKAPEEEKTVAMPESVRRLLMESAQCVQDTEKTTHGAHKHNRRSREDVIAILKGEKHE